MVCLIRGLKNSHHCVLANQVTGSVGEWTVEEVLVNSRQCEDFFYRNCVRLTGRDSSSVTIPREVLQRLAEWSALKGRSILWLEGDYSHTDDLENPLSLFAMQFITLLERTKLPIISYFCDLKRAEKLRPGNTTIEQQGIVALGHALLRQMIELLLPTFVTAADFSETRFARLDGTVKSWSTLLEVLNATVPLMPSTVYVIIDGVHWLDDRSVAPMQKQLISFLREHGDKLRALFTTSGRSGVLLEEINTNDHIHLDEGMLQGYGIALDRSSFFFEDS